MVYKNKSRGDVHEYKSVHHDYKVKIIISETVVLAFQVGEVL